MAKYEFVNEHKSRRALTIGDCSDGDIISAPSEDIHIGMVIDCSDCSYCHVSVVDFDGGEIMEIHQNTPCRRYKGTLKFDNNLFEEFYD